MKLAHTTRAAALLAILLAGCSVTPPYQRPLVETPTRFKEASGEWKIAEPAEAAPRGDWWKAFADPTLDTLEQQAAENNQDLKAGLARLLQARAAQQGEHARLFPQIGIGTGPTRQRASPASQRLAADADSSPYTLWRAQASVDYEADLFGRISSGVDAASADAEQRAALFQSLRLAIQADVAQGYFSLRELDTRAAQYRDTVALRTQELDLIERRFEAGDLSELERARARTELATARAEAIGVARQRAVAEHALAILLGRAPSAFALPPQPLQRVALSVPPGLPSALLERRPDIAAAERALVAANARIGSARAAFFPQLSLTGALGYESAQLGDLFNWSSRAFLLGPLAGTMLTLPLIDGGARRAGVDRATAVYEEDVAAYRETVLRAFKEVEDNLAHLRLLGEQIEAQDMAVTSARRAAALSQTRYREGSVSQLDVIDAERSVLQQQNESVRLDADRARATVALIQALGGGWDRAVVD